MTKDQWKIKRLNQARVVSGAKQWNSVSSDGFNGMFLLIRNGRRLACIASDQDGWEHVSVTDQTTRNSQKVCPTWDDMCFIKRAFWDDDEAVMELHVPQAAWVNQHEGCLHLWKPLGQEIPLPPSMMVGYQDL